MTKKLHYCDYSDFTDLRKSNYNSYAINNKYCQYNLTKINNQ